MVKLLIAIIAIAAASAGAQDLSGEYRLSMPEMASGLMLKTDRTFEYFFSYGAADYTGKGTWKSEAGAVVLNSSGQEEPPFRLVKSALGSGPEIRVYVKAKNGRGVQHIDVKVTTASGASEARTDSDGMAVLEGDRPAKSIAIHIPVYDIDAGPFEVAGTDKEFWFEINGDAITQVRFKNERLAVTNGGLQMNYWRGDKPLLYRKRGN